MTTDREIRQWAREAGHDVPVRGRLNEEFRELYAAAHPDAVMTDNPSLSVIDGGAEGPGVRPPEPLDTGEVAPTPPPGLAGKLLGGGRRSGSGMRPPKKRVSLEELAAGAWGLLGTAAGQQGLMPTARVLQMQAPIAGAILEDTLRDTLADKVLQPLARGQQTAGEVFSLIGPPVIVTAISMNPARAPMLLPMLKGMMRQWVLLAGPRLKAKAKREEKALKDMGVEDPASLDAMLDDMINGLFDGMWAQPGDGGLSAAA
ncbi:hypothetical protein [Kitasatospora sp. NPDC057198]|uniref:Lsr2 family DNA-binding protein n=1 Tax=Kitasatospora sp. NPDC057198 TaxID=3346046 RepID=UPI00363E2691